MVPRQAPRASHHLHVPPSVDHTNASPLRTPSPSSFASDDNGDADDEHSTSPSRHSSSSMGSLTPEPTMTTREPAYPGEDTRPTSRKELLGFYTYSFAAEVFVVCGLGAFIPITLEDLARGSATAVLASDHSRPCKVQGLDTRGAGANKHALQQCVVRILGNEVNTASFAMYTFSISVLLQALVVVTMSGAADHGRYRKTLLISFAVLGSVATMLFLPVTPKVYLLGSLWAIISNINFGASFVLLNSFLPVLVRHHPDVQMRRGRSSEQLLAEDDEGELDDTHASDEPLLRETPASAMLASEETAPYAASYAASSPDMRLSTKISSYGVGIGYVAAVIVQLLSIAILKSTGATLFSLRLVLFSIGLWWLAFTLPAALFLRPRPGPPLPPTKTGTPRTWSTYLAYSWLNLGRTILRARKLKDITLFLAAWFLISDGIATVSGTAILFAKTSLGMQPAALALINVTVTLSGIAGAFTWSTVSRMLQLKPSHTILTCICLFELIPLYGLLGYIPAIQRYGSFGLQQQWEMYPLGAVYGLVLGGLSSYCRSLFGELIPPGSEAAFYALYAITDKGSSVFGPAVVGAITDATGDIRPAFWFLAVLIGVPVPIMWFVDVERGKREAIALAREMRG
ncbi:Autophagy protein 22 [Friedmanniomyces endolithicus]|nr:Autophagy protein 22 [Friedmanniomyces endolithicus]KAK0826120.1 Autophagy protein 22 [Friedmanniomyces endolithicus]